MLKKTNTCVAACTEYQVSWQTYSWGGSEYGPSVFVNDSSALSAVPVPPYAGDTVFSICYSNSIEQRMASLSHCLLMFYVSVLTGCSNIVCGQTTVVDLLHNLTVTTTTVYAYANGTQIGAIMAADTVDCPLPLLPRITNVTFTINTARGKTFSCDFVNTDRRLGGLLFGDIHGRQQCAGEIQFDRSRQRTKQCH